MLFWRKVSSQKLNQYMGSIHKLNCACNFSQDSWVRADTAQQK